MRNKHWFRFGFHSGQEECTIHLEIFGKLFEELEKLERIKGKAYVTPAYGLRVIRHKRARMATKCLIELWKWHDMKYPERVFD
ncbi:MAG: hypothetical protein ACFFCO_12405 [Promethearchaeota archaeon]